MGRVALLSGQPQEGVAIEAPSDSKGYYEEAKTENVFPLPLSNFFQVKGLSRGKHLVQLKFKRPSSSHKLVSEIIEVDFGTNAQIHVGPLRYNIVADHQSQEVTPAAILPLVTGIAEIALFISIPRLKEIYQATVGMSSPGFTASTKREPRKAVPRKKTF